MKFFAKIIKKYKDIKMELTNKDLKEFYDFKIMKLQKKVEINKIQNKLLIDEISKIKEKKKAIKA